jgi:DNA-binding ferritin-like protein
MLVSNHTQVSDSHGHPGSTDGDAEHKTIAILSELLGKSIDLRDLYKNARLQTAYIPQRGLRQLFERHYKEQLPLVDLLTDRIRTMGGARQLLASKYLQSTRLVCALRGNKAGSRLLRELLDAHEAVLNICRPNGSAPDEQWSRDFAVGQVVLTNDAHRATVSDQLADSDPRQRSVMEYAHALLD